MTKIKQVQNFLYPIKPVESDSGCFFMEYTWVQDLGFTGQYTMKPAHLPNNAEN